MSHCGIVREFVPPFALRVALFGIYACVFVALLFFARDSVLDLDFGDIGFKKESLLVFVCFLGKGSMFESLAKMKMANFWEFRISGSEVGFLKV